jgi:hypothetical protein
MDVAATTGATPSMLFGAAPHLAWVSTSSGLGVGVRLGASRATSGETEVPDGSADFTRTVGLIDVCAVLASAELRLAGCAHVEAGALEAVGIRVPAPRAETRGWLGTGPVLRGEWSLLSPMFLEAEIGAVAHLLRERFYFLPDTTAYRVPLMGGYGSVGVGIRFL